MIHDPGRVEKDGFSDYSECLAYNLKLRSCLSLDGEGQTLGFTHANKAPYLQSTFAARGLSLGVFFFFSDVGHPELTETLNKGATVGVRCIGMYLFTYRKI